VLDRPKEAWLKEYQRRTMFAIPGTRYLVADPLMCGGRPTIEFTRIPISSVVGYRNSGMTPDTIVIEFFWIGEEAKVVEALAWADSDVGKEWLKRSG
jgi:uncharacterized protein (DUF433 family)